MFKSIRSYVLKRLRPFLEIGALGAEQQNLFIYIKYYLFGIYLECRGAKKETLLQASAAQSVGEESGRDFYKTLVEEDPYALQLVVLGFVLSLILALSVKNSPAFALEMSRILKPIPALFLGFFRYFIVLLIAPALWTTVYKHRETIRVAPVFLLLLVCTGVMAAFWAILFSGFIVRPGEGLALSVQLTPAALAKAKPGIGLLSPFSWASEHLLSVILASVIGALATSLKPSIGDVLCRAIGKVETVAFTVVRVIVKFLPIVVFAMVFPLVVSNGAGVVAEAGYKIGLAQWTSKPAHMLVLLGLMIVSGGLRPTLGYLKTMFVPLMQGFSSSSSLVALEPEIEHATEYGIDESTATLGFTLGCTFNMDGTLMSVIISAITILQSAGIIITPETAFFVALTALGTSVATAPVPNASLILLIEVVESAFLHEGVSIPEAHAYAVAGLALVSIFEAWGDRVRTLVNLYGDVALVWIIHSFTGTSSESN